MIGEVQWETRYGDVLDTANDTGVIPLIGVRIVVGVTRDGRRQLLCEIDADADDHDKLALLGALSVVESQLRHGILVNMGVLP